MFWRRKKSKDDVRPADDYDAYVAKLQSRIRDIGEIDHGYTDEDAAEVEARLRNLNYGTNRD